jgi:hypothetical protein
VTSYDRRPCGGFSWNALQGQRLSKPEALVGRDAHDLEAARARVVEQFSSIGRPQGLMRLITRGTPWSCRAATTSRECIRIP